MIYIYGKIRQEDRGKPNPRLVAAIMRDTMFDVKFCARSGLVLMGEIKNDVRVRA